MLYSQDILEEVRIQNDIVEVISGYIPLKQKGRTYFGLCPFHNESTPSFSVSPDKQLYYCFGCGAAGNVFSFIMQMENCDFVEALKRLAQRANIKLPEGEYSKERATEEEHKKRIYEIHSEAGLFYYEALQGEEGSEAREYLNKRELSVAIQRKFGLGYAPKGSDRLYKFLKEKGFNENDIVRSGLCLESKNKKGFYDRFSDRLMFPIFDIQGRCIAFGGRIMSKGEPKYLNSPETLLFNKRRTLYGLNFARGSKKKEIVLVEGYMDAISIHQAGFHNVSASLGTAFSKEHAITLRKFLTDIILVFDSDTAGEAATLRAIPILLEQGFKVKVLKVPNGKDPDDFIKQNGSLEFGKLLVNAKGHMSFEIDCIKKKYNLNSTEGKLDFTKEAALMLSKLDSPIERDVYTKEIAKETKIAEDAIFGEILKLKDANDIVFAKDAEKKRLRLYNQRSANEGIKNSKGVWQAQCNILFLCATNKEFYEKIKEHIAPENFIDDIYIKLAKIVFETAEGGKQIFPAEVVNFFETPEEQKKIAEVFTIKFTWASKTELEKIVSEEIKLIKRTKADILASNASTVEEIESFLKIKKEIENFYIYL